MFVCRFAFLKARSKSMSLAISNAVSSGISSSSVDSKDDIFRGRASRVILCGQELEAVRAYFQEKMQIQGIDAVVHKYRRALIGGYMFHAQVSTFSAASSYFMRAFEESEFPEYFGQISFFFSIVVRSKMYRLAKVNWKRYASPAVDKAGCPCIMDMPFDSKKELIHESIVKLKGLLPIGFSQTKKNFKTILKFPYLT